MLHIASAQLKKQNRIVMYGRWVLLGSEKSRSMVIRFFHGMTRSPKTHCLGGKRKKTSSIAMRSEGPRRRRQEFVK